MLGCRYLDRAVDADNPLRRRYTDYESMRIDVLGKKDDVEFKAPITICDIYGSRTQEVLDAIHSVAVSGPGGSSKEHCCFCTCTATSATHLQCGGGLNSADRKRICARCRCWPVAVPGVQA
jgi:hypothetical protein